MKKIVLIASMILMLNTGVEDAVSKQADLAGIWYPGSPEKLKAEVATYLNNAQVGHINGNIIGAIAPHAGIRFSGPIAAYTYRALAGQNLTKLVIVGFSHKYYFPNTVSVFSDDSFITPLGSIKIDMPLSEKIMASNPSIKNFPEAFASENSIELQLPFIQTVFGDNIQVVLISLCDQSKENAEMLADTLYKVLKDEKNFAVVASTDMCHYLSYFEAERRDRNTIKEIQAFEPELFYLASAKEDHKLMCGYGAVYAVMETSKKLGADKSIVLKYGNSGDFAPQTKNSVVGYLSALFIKTAEEDNTNVVGDEKNTEINFPETSETEDAVQGKKEEIGMLNEAQRKELLKIARDSIKLYLEKGKRLNVQTDDALLKENMGAFVTLHETGRLRGCIGRIIAAGPLYLAVRDMAIAAAVEDPRFRPLSLDELGKVDIEISVLSPMKKINDSDEIVMGKHGVMIKDGLRSGVYLPQVADETGWDRETFMNSLCVNKAGLSQDAWKTGSCEIYVFTAEVFGEHNKPE
ncbi:MAG: AmmeMemoRadiSam system protein B [Candidatus Omnitrophota bacterium]